MPSYSSTSDTALDLAARLLAGEPDAVRQILGRHRARTDGYCTGCGPSLIRWPCFVANAAAYAERLAQDGSDPDGVPSA